MMYYTMKASKGNQWGKDTFSVQFSIPEIANILRIEPEVQRKINKRQVNEIASYLIDASTGKRDLASVGSITTSLRNADYMYDENSALLSVESQGQLVINDGQHRTLGSIEALKKVDELIYMSRESDDNTEYKKWSNAREKILQFRLPILIYVEMTEEMEKQLFHDLNNLARSVTKTAALNFDHNDPYNRISKELEREIPEIRGMGIHKTAKALTDKNKEIASLAVWNTCTRIIINGSKGLDEKAQWNSSWEYEEEKEKVKSFWLTLFEILPKDFNNRKKYIVTKSVFLQGLATWASQIINNGNNWGLYVYHLRDFDWTYDNNLFSHYGGGAMVQGKFQFKGSRSAIKSIPLTLNDFARHEILKS